MNIGKTFHATSRAAWRAWLKKNHQRVTEIWLVYDKKADGARKLPYADAVEEALCFGWIDGIVKPIDERQYAQRYSPRKKGSNWSAVNRTRFVEMVEAGLMTEAGDAVGPHDAPPVPTRWSVSDPLPEYIDRKLKGAARRNFDAMARTYREMYVRMIVEAKQEATRMRRLEQTIERLAKGLKPFDNA